MRKEPIVVQLELAKKRCRRVIDRIEALPAFNNSINASCQHTLLKLAQSELSFLCRSSSALNSLSVNIGHIEAVVHILQQPFITGVSRVCKPIFLSPTTKNGQKSDSCLKGVHVDIVCTLNRNPVWILVSDRNPKYILWNQSKKYKGLKFRIEQILIAAQSSIALKPSSIILFFSNGLSSLVYEKLKEEFGAAELGLEFSVFDFVFTEDSEGEWINVLARTYQEACILEIKVYEIRHAVKAEASECDAKVSSPMVAEAELSEDHMQRNMGFSFCSLLSRMEVCLLHVKDAECTKQQNLLGGGDFINFDTTALIALISGISNGATKELLATPEGKLRQRFKGNYEFVIGQVMSEIQNPMHVELGSILSGKGGIICESACSEFKDLVAMCGGSNEKLRAAYLLRKLMVLPDCPSDRIMSLPTTRKLALKNKVVFGTGDYWHAPTLTANMAFVRAISQTGMSLFTIVHKPRALTGD